MENTKTNLQWKQYIVALGVNIGSVVGGIGMGWMSPSQLILMDPNGPLNEPLTLSQVAVLGSIMPLGSLVGSAFGGPICTYWGRRSCLRFSAPALLIGWPLSGFSRTFAPLVISRGLWGLAFGLQFIAFPIYFSEIGTDDARGELGSFGMLSHVIGVQLAYMIAPKLSLSRFSIVGIVLSTCFLIALKIIPESPIHHLRQGKIQDAKDSLRRLRNKTEEEISKECEVMESVTKTMPQESQLRDLFATKASRRAVAIAWGLMFTVHLSGLTFVISYMTYVLKLGEPFVDANTGTEIVGWVRLFICTAAIFYIDRFGRRFLLISGLVLMAISLFSFGTFIFIVNNKYDIAKDIGFVPIFSLILYMIGSCGGYGPTCMALSCEVLPIRIRGTAMGMGCVASWITNMSITYSIDFFAKIGLQYAFWIFGICSTIAAISCALWIPETQGKSLHEIQRILQGHKHH